MKKISFSLLIICFSFCASILSSQAMLNPEEETKCRFFNGQPGSCRHGAKCKFSHVKETSEKNNRSFGVRKETPQEYRERQEKRRIKEEYRETLEQEAEELDLSRNGVKFLTRKEGLDSQKSQEEYRETLEQEAAELGLSTYGSINELKRTIKEKKEEDYRETYREMLEQEAKNLGLLTYGSTNELKRTIKEKRQEDYRETLEQEAKNLGLLTYESTNELKRKIKEKKQEEYQERLETEAKKLSIRVYSNTSIEELKRQIGEKKSEQREKTRYRIDGASNSFLAGERDFRSGSNSGYRELTRYGRPSYQESLAYNNGCACARGPRDSDWTK